MTNTTFTAAQFIAAASIIIATVAFRILSGQLVVAPLF